MPKKNMLAGKRILIVDDEPDVLQIVSSELPMCEVKTAVSFDEAKEALNTRYYDLVILDIMGVKGFELLEIAKQKKVIPVMLTAHALSVDNTKKSYEKGAAFFIPKEKMADIQELLNDIFEAKARGKSTWQRWLDRLDWYYSNRFGPDWKESDKEFWGRILNGEDPNRLK
jgi:DNA-binding NtrC family response regulator